MWKVCVKSASALPSRLLLLGTGMEGGRCGRGGASWPFAGRGGSDGGLCRFVAPFGGSG